MENNIERRLVTYQEALRLVKKEYMSRKAKYDRTVDHVALYDLAIQLDIPRDKIIIPSVRGHLSTALKYPVAEYLWYQSEDRKVDIMSKFGPIWKHMVDENGLVNSNYGYQIARVLKNKYQREDFIMAFAEELYNKKEATINILDDDNLYADNDVPCNNVFHFTWDAKDNQLQVVVVARSLDLIFGYPYDICYVQLLGNEIIQLMKKIDSRNYWLKEIQYIPINGHIYTKDLDPKLTEKWHLIDDEFVEISADIVKDERVSKENCKKYSTEEEYRAIRKQLISEYGRGLAKYPQRLNDLNKRQPKYLGEDLIKTFKINLDSIPDGYIDDLWKALANGSKCYYDEDRLEKFLIANLNVDRKVAIYIPDLEYNKSSLIYLDRDMRSMPYPDDLIVSVTKWRR